MNKEFVFKKIGYQPDALLLYFEGDFGRIDILLEEEIDVGKTVSHSLVIPVRSLLSSKEFYLNSEKIEVSWVKIYKGKLLIKI